MKYNSLSLLALCLLSVALRQASAAVGNIYVSSTSDGSAIVRVTEAGEVETTLPFIKGTDLAFDVLGNLYIKTPDGQIIKQTPVGVAQSVFATNDGGKSIAVDKLGNVFTTVNDTIFKYTPDGAKTVFASNVGFIFDLAFDANGNLYGSNYSTNLVVKFSPAGVKTPAVIGINLPTALAFDREGNLFVASDETNASGSGVIYKVLANGDGARTLFASRTAQIKNMVVDRVGRLYHLESTGASITRYQPTGEREGGFVTGLSGAAGLAIEPPTGHLRNVATRMNVQTGDNAAIAGMIISGTGQKRLLIRGIGPSLANAGVAGALADPTLGLFRSNGTLILDNNNWKDTQQVVIEQSGLAPTNDLESAIGITVFAPTTLTAVLRGLNNGTGVGLIEVYDRNAEDTAQVANLSTRGFVGTGQNVLIGGFIVSGGTNGAVRVIVRALGPSLADAGVPGALVDPKLSLYDANGLLLSSNDDWHDSSTAGQISASGLAPTKDLESVIIRTLVAGNYTAIVEGYQGATGVGLVEVYNVP